MLSLMGVPTDELKAQEHREAVTLAMSTRRSGAAAEARSDWEGWLSEPKGCWEEVAISDRFSTWLKKRQNPTAYRFQPE